MIYFFILGLISLMAVVELLTGWSLSISVNKRLLWIGFAIFLLLFSGLRYKIGYDYEAYHDIFTMVGPSGNILNLFVEPSFAILTIVSYNLTHNYQILIFAVATLAIIPKFIFLRKYVELPFLGLLLYFSRYYLIYDMGQIRQGLAFVLVLFSLYPLLKGQASRFILLIIIAATIHISSLCFLPMYYLGRAKLSNRFVYSSLIVCFLMAVIDLKPVVLALTSFLPVFISQKITFYLATEESIGLTFSIFFRFIIVCVFAFYRDKIISKRPIAAVVFNIYFIGVCIYLFFNSVPQIGNRISAYFQIYEIMVVPLLFLITRDRWFRIGIFIFILLYAIWGANNTIHSIDDAFLPYRSVFSEN